MPNSDDSNIDTDSTANEPAAASFSTRNEGVADDGFADADALTVSRDGDGELLPETVYTDQYGKVKVVPLTYGDVEEYFGDSDVADIGAEVIAALLRGHVREPDLNAAAGGEVDAAWVREELKPLAPRDLIMAILEASDIQADVDMQGQGEAQVAFDQQGGN